jgi:iron transport multicopper oxidase
MHHVYRSGYSVESTEELRAAIEMDLASGKEPDRTPDGLTCIFVFSGQGSQYTGMGKELFTTCSVFRECILDCNAICINLGFGPFLNLILHEEIKLGDFTSAQTQLALVSLEIALLNTWKSWGIEPDIVMGHSLGEYVALCAAGVLSVYDVLYLIGSRGQLMQSNCAPYTHSMLAIESSCNIVEKVLESEEFSDCTISCINSQCSTVVSGSLEKLKALRSKFEGTRTSMLNLPYAFHSAQVDPVLDEFRLVSAGVRFNKPRIPVISTLLGLAVEKEGVFGADYLARQTREPVDFLRGVKACKQKAMGPRSVWLEVGPAPVCLGLMRSTVATSVDHMIPTLKPNTNSWTTVSKAVSQLYTTGANIQWASYHKDCIQSLHLLRMPTYAFDTKKYWIPYEGDWALMTRDYPKTNGLLSNFSTTCLQRIDEEVHEQHSSSITFSSDMAEPGLFGMIQGHLVHGFGLCPSSVYTDMAMTAASYLFQKMEDTKEVPAMNVANMEIFNPLVVLPSSLNSIFKLQAKRRKDSTSVDIQCSSEHNTISQQHAHCTVEFESHQIWKRKWDQTEHLVNARSDTLIGAAKSGQAHNILQAMVYKLFANLVLYSERYRSIQEVFMHDTLNEGAAILKFHPLERGEEFTLSPYWVDAIIHLGGFVLNGHAKVPEDTAYICTGWDSLCVPTDLSCEEHYTSYVHMRSTGHGMFLGNIFLLKDGETLAMCGGLRFQQIRKASLQTLLSTVSGKLGDNPLAIRGVNPTHCDTTFSSQEYQSLSRAPLPRNSTCTSSAARLLEVRRIIAEEADMECSELPGHVGFEELGIDSILKMHISSKIQEHTKLIIPPSVFNTCPTISAFLEYIEKTKEFTTPGITLDRPETARTCSSSSDITAVDSAGDPNVFDTLLSIISAESGIEKSELTSSSKFVDLGVDSLISIAVVSRLKDQTGKMLPSSFFKDHPTVSMAKQALYPSTTCQFTGTCASSQDKSSKPPRFSRTVFLQGDPESEDPCLFLVADGSGSPAAYHHLPPLPSGIPVYGLESPFCHEPMEWDCSFADVAVMYKEAIRRIQPHGPYTIGGWSLGGMQAFEITRQLLLEGERVQRLLLIDAPSPKSLLHVPEPTMEVLENIGLFNALRKAGMQGDTFLRTQQHLMQSIRALNKYDPEAISSDRRPENVSVIWGASGIFEQLGDRVTQATELACREGGPLNPEETNELQRWMTTPREDFGPNGWERLVGEDIQCYRTDGDHFSMMNPPLVCLPLTVSKRTRD